MSLRFRRNRLIIILIITILSLIYLLNNSSETLKVDDEIIVRRKTHPRVKINERTTATMKKPFRSVREEIVEIDGKQVKRIDWHDYDSIERENARTGRFYLHLTSTLRNTILLLNRYR